MIIIILQSIRSIRACRLSGFKEISEFYLYLNNLSGFSDCSNPKKKIEQVLDQLLLKDIQLSEHSK